MSNIEDEGQEVPNYVDLGDGRVTIEYDDIGQKLDLANMFPENSAELEGDKVEELYFVTSSGNIYNLNSEGILISANRGGKQYCLKPENLKHLGLEVGSRFYHPFEPRVIKTSPVTKIVAITGKKYSDEMKGNVRKSDIKEKFEEIMGKGNVHTS
ncbi:MAG: hypothetical protein ACOX0R_00810 [Candidatus Dojkabacteria bacterium]|jgi:hypothetical protein